jgi:hypothetical protein
MCHGVIAGFLVAGGAIGSTPDEVATRVRHAASHEETQVILLAARSGADRLDPDADMTPLLAVAADASVRFELRQVAISAVLGCESESALRQCFGLAARWTEHLPGDCARELEVDGGGSSPVRSSEPYRLFSWFLQGAAVHPALRRVEDSPERRLVLNAAIRWNCMASALIRDLPMSDGERGRHVLHLVPLSGLNFGHPLLSALREPELAEIRRWVGDSFDEASGLSRKGYQAVKILATLGDQPGLEAIRALHERIPKGSFARDRAFLERMIQLGSARQSPEGILAQIRSPEALLTPGYMDWALASALSMGVSRQAIMSALDERKASMRAWAKARNSPARSYIARAEDRLAEFKQMAIAAGIMGPADWPDVKGSDGARGHGP